MARAQVLAFFDGFEFAEVDLDPVAIVVTGLRVAREATATQTAKGCEWSTAHAGAARRVGVYVQRTGRAAR